MRKVKGKGRIPFHNQLTTPSELRSYALEKIMGYYYYQVNRKFPFKKSENTYTYTFIAEAGRSEEEVMWSERVVVVPKSWVSFY